MHYKCATHDGIKILEEMYSLVVISSLKFEFASYPIETQEAKKSKASAHPTNFLLKICNAD